MEGLDGARLRDELLGILGIDAALHGMALDMHVVLAKRQRLAGGGQDLGPDQVQPGHALGHRVLDLDAGVHLDEVELPVLVEKLEGARAQVADALAGVGADLADALALLGGDAGRGGFLDHLLVPALHRAVALAQVHGITVAVGEHLDLDVARIGQEFFHVDRGVTESRLGLLAREVDRLDQVLRVFDHAHTATTAARCGLDQHRVADLVGQLPGAPLVVVERSVGAGHAGHARLAHGVDGRHLVAHQADGLRTGPDEGEARFLDALGEIGVLGKETVAGMHGLGVGHLHGRDDRRHIEVALVSWRRSDAHGLVGHAHVLEIAIHRRVNGHGADAHGVTGAQDA